MRHAFDIAGTETEVWLARDGRAYRLDGDAGGARVALDDGRLTVDGITEPVVVVIDGEDIHVHLGGANHVLHHKDPARRFADQDAGGGADAARAPMPGTVVRIDVAVGQSVASGEPLIVIESMKLETTIRAARDGIVEAIHVGPAQSFERDALLVTLAEAS